MTIKSKLDRTEDLLDESLACLGSTQNLLVDAIEICKQYHKILEEIAKETGEPQLTEMLDEALKPLELTNALSNEAAMHIGRIIEMARAIRRGPNIVTLN